MSETAGSENDAFPDVRWGKETSRLRPALVAFAASPVGSWLVRTLTPIDRRLLTRSRGRFTVLGPVGAPVLLLTTTGRKSGLPRTTPLIYLREPGRVSVVASNFGQAHHPAWSGNLLADPHATVTIGGRDVSCRATALEGAERDRVYAAFEELARTYAVYKDRTARDIRVFTLVPA